VSAQPVTLDMSTAQPIAAPAPVKLDMSTAQPLDQAADKPSTAEHIRDNFLSGIGVTDDEGAKNFFRHPLNTLMDSFKGQGELYQKAKDSYDRGDYKGAVIHGLNYLVPFIGQQTDKAGEQLEKGDYSGGISRTLGAAVPIVAGSPEVQGGISDLASAAADRAASAAKTAARITPKQAAQTAGAASGAVAGHGTLSPVGAYYGAKTFGHIAEAVLGKERANLPIFQKAATLDDAAESLSQVIAKDRAGSSPAMPAGSGVTAADRAAAKSLLHDALKQQSGDVVDTAIPPGDQTHGANLATKSRVEFYLQRGDVANAEKSLDAGAKQANPAWQPLDRQPVPSTNEIRARIQAEAKIPPAGGAADNLDTHALQQEMNWNLERHGWSAESEARREFIARNSTGMTKGELGKRFAAGSGKSAPAAAPATPDDLTEVLQKSLDAVRARSKGK
jgi:hypothetical protein